MLNTRHPQKYAMDLVRHFDIDEMLLKQMWVFKAEDLSPDSAAAALITYSGSDESRVYVIYSEDFIESLEYVQKQVVQWCPCEILETLRPKQPIPFEDTTGSQYYNHPNPEEVKKWMQYAVPDDYAYAFLFRVRATKENPSYWT